MAEPGGVKEVYTNSSIDSLKDTIIKKYNEENKAYIIKYSMVLIIISLTLAIIGVLDYYFGWTSANSELFTLIYGINWFVLALNIMYFINTSQRASFLKKIQ